ncbi:MAG: CDP-diacylglycerol--glycerol-3-phosphate 3-phosphatidyltransferase [Pirellulales bacterium]|nr:CDP-diacylglycerol--glycerol-3-phosphate 3-phosphatidyltransferase [Pirellulales bacterium]
MRNPMAEPATKNLFNLPNQLTSLRLVLTVVMFVFIAWEFYLTSFILFVIAASTDWLDGYFARKYGQVTTLGRILDPFADKVIICGTFVFLVAVPAMRAAPWGGLQAWMVVVILGRELLVTALRSFIEQRGGDFSAKMAGKWKMLLQCVAAAAGLCYLAFAVRDLTPPWWCWITLAVSLWVAVALTIYSGAEYIVVAIRVLRASRSR